MPTAVILLSAVTAGYFDLRWRRVPNWLVLATITLSLVWHGSAEGWMGVWRSGLGLVLGILLLFPLFLLRGMGAGDVKFFGALGAAVTYSHLLTLLGLSLIISSTMALIKVLRKGAWEETTANIADVIRRLLQGHLEPHPVVGIDSQKALLVPFTFAVAIAAWIIVFIHRG